MNQKPWVVYLIRCSDESLYCGITNDLHKRLEMHNLGKGAKYTKSRRPVGLIGIGPEMTKSDALKLEYRVKQAPAHRKKSELTRRRNREMKNLKNDLLALNNDIRSLAGKIKKLIVAVEKMDKSTGLKTKVSKKVAAKKVAVHKPVKKKVVVKKPAAKKAAVNKPAAEESVKLSMSDTVLGFITRSRKGIDTAALLKKTGTNRAHIHNIVSRLKKQGKVKTTGRGIYMRT